MRHLIPNQSNDTDANSENDPLTDDLKFKFQTIQRYLSQQSQLREGNKNDTSVHPVDDTDDETLDSSSDEAATLMALSTAISAQHEIDSLLNGISELESMLQEEDIFPHREELQGHHNPLILNQDQLDHDEQQLPDNQNDTRMIPANSNCKTNNPQNHFYPRDLQASSSQMER